MISSSRISQTGSSLARPTPDLLCSDISLELHAGLVLTLRLVIVIDGANVAYNHLIAVPGTGA